MPSYTASKPSTGGALYVPPGDYKLKVLDAVDETSSNGNEMITMRMGVIMPDGSKGPSFFERLVFTPKSFYRIDNFLASCGEHPGEGKSRSLEADDVIGWECRARLKVEEYDGRKNNKVEAYLWEEEF